MHAEETYLGHGVISVNGPVTAQKGAAPDQTTLTALREYRLSLALLAAGIVMVVAISVLSIWTPLTSGTSFWTGLTMQVTLTAGGMLILLRRDRR